MKRYPNLEPFLVDSLIESLHRTKIELIKFFLAKLKFLYVTPCNQGLVTVAGSVEMVDRCFVWHLGITCTRRHYE